MYIFNCHHVMTQPNAYGLYMYDTFGKNKKANLFFEYVKGTVS